MNYSPQLEEEMIFYNPELQNHLFTLICVTKTTLSLL